MMDYDKKFEEWVEKETELPKDGVFSGWWFFVGEIDKHTERFVKNS